jgi:sulfopyruvate decarboxylase TPP-binding subunit
MDQDTIRTIINTFKEERIDLVVTLPEEPTSPLTEEIRKDPSFTSITVAGEGTAFLCALAPRSEDEDAFL